MIPFLAAGITFCARELWQDDGLGVKSKPLSWLRLRSPITGLVGTQGSSSGVCRAGTSRTLLELQPLTHQRYCFAGGNPREEERGGERQFLSSTQFLKTPR